MKIIAITISLLLFSVSAPDFAQAFQGGGGESTKPKPKPTPKPAPKPASGPAKGPGRITPVPPSGPTAEVTIKTDLAGCAVVIDGVTRGNTGQDGTLSVPKLRAGSHTLVVTKAGYQKYQNTIELSADQSLIIEATLTPLPVNLAINPNISGARIEVNGQTYNDFADLQLMPGTYQVRITKPGYRGVTKEVELHPARPLTIPVTLERISVEELIAQAEQDFKAQRYDQVITACLDVISAQPDHPRAILLLGQSNFAKENHDDSVFYLVKAARLGEQATLPIKHHHSSGFCSGQLVISKDQFGFRADDGAHSFGAPWAKVYELSVESYRGVPRLNARVGVMKGRKEDKQRLNFLPAQSTATSSGVQCQDCGPKMNAIYQVLQQLRR